MELQKINTQKQLLRGQIKEKIVCLDPLIWIRSTAFGQISVSGNGF